MGLVLLLLLIGGTVAMRNGVFGELPRRMIRGGLPPAFILGGIGLVIGYFGPLYWAPEANQGPLLGIFVTGPLGFAIGLGFGVVRELIRAGNESTP